MHFSPESHPTNMETGYEALRTSAAWIDYTTHGNIRVTGEDAARLLHAMSTNSITDLAPGNGIYAFFLTDKGRIMADACIFRVGDEFFLDTEPEGAHIIHHHLDKYIIADDALTADESTLWFEVAIEGPDSPAAMERLGLPIPPEPLSILSAGWGYVARISSTGPLGFRVWAGEDRRLSLFNELSAALPQATSHDAKVVRLENGLPRFDDDFGERYLVQETRLLNAISFSKGCYLGQEIVERIRSQGKVHRLLTPVRITGSIPPPPGAKLVAATAQAGEITSAAYSPALGEVVALAYVRAEFLNQDHDLQIADMDPAIRARAIALPGRELHETVLR
jgi:folate-binding protein YgfZ